MAELVLDRISKRYPSGTCALRDLSLTIGSGELLTVVGPSGSGKTTLLRLVAGLEELTAGEILIDGQPAGELPPRLRDVAMVFQRSALYPHMTIRENLTFPLRIADGFGGLLRRRRIRKDDRESVDRTEQDKQVEEVAKRLGIAQVLDRYPGEVSGGQQQRTALGKALMRRSRIILLDEPLGNLDTGLRDEMRYLLHLLHENFPATIIYVTHDQSEAMALGDRLAVIDEGILQQCDPPRKVYERPLNRTVARLVGWPPMNLIDGVLERAGGQLCWSSRGLRLAVSEAWHADLDAWVDARVAIGIRPEDVRLGVPGHEVCCEAKVTAVEYMGAGSLVTCEVQKAHMNAWLAGYATVAVGARVRLGVNAGRAHFFDMVTGLAVNRERQTG